MLTMITPRHSHGDENAHAWMNLDDYQIQVQNICNGLSEADSTHADRYAANAQTYQAKVQELQQETAELASQIAAQPVVIFHESIRIYRAGIRTAAGRRDESG